MKKYLGFAMLVLLAMPIALLAQKSDNAELKKMYEDDQQGRAAKDIGWVQLNQDDRKREKRVYELIDSNKLATGRDYYHSAMIFQHGVDSVAYGMAVKQMRKAIALDTSIDRWLLAAAIDRDLMSRNKPQIYGTQYMKRDAKAPFTRYWIDSTKVTDAERRYYHVETLAEQRVKERLINLLPIAGHYAVGKSIDSSVLLIKNQFALGEKSVYNVTEGGLNDFGYELMAKGELAEAEMIFTLNTELYPAAYNTFDSLGECLLKRGKNDLAYKAYKKSLELNPGNGNAVKVLEGMR